MRVLLATALLLTCSVCAQAQVFVPGRFGRQTVFVPFTVVPIQVAPPAKLESLYRAQLIYVERPTFLGRLFRGRYKPVVVLRR